MRRFKSTLVSGPAPLIGVVWLIVALSIIANNAASQSLDEPATCSKDAASCASTSNLSGSGEDGAEVKGSPVDHRERAHKFFTSLDLFQGELSVAQLELASITSRHLYNIYDEVAIQQYDNYAMFQQSTGGQLDQELCLHQLEQLHERANVWLREKSSSLDLNLYMLLDTYGRISPGVSSNHNIWQGMYTSCLRMTIDFAEGPSATRYCMASLRRNSWPQDDELSRNSAFKSGVCLPRACDSTRYSNKYELIDGLIKFNWRQVDRDETILHDLFCLPDEDSPLRNWLRAPMVVVAIAVCSSWFSLLVYATIKYEKFRQMRSGRKSANLIGNDESGLGALDGYKLYQSLSITANLEALFATGKASVEANGDGKTKSARRVVVNFDCMEGIKVFCMCYIILGHVTMCLSTLAMDTREVAGSLSPAWIVSNMMPAFAVNAFFTITGLLTYRVLLKQNNLHSFMTSPLKWAMIMIYRYLRIMPMYALVVYYCKYISKFTGAGPSWDYGTSSLAGRRRCEQESWLWTLLFGANLKSPFHHCVPSAWYLANDFQFFLVTPIFMITLHKSPKLGKRLLIFCTAASYLAGMLAVLRVDADIRPIAEFMPHGFATYVTLFSFSYTLPHYRIASYLVGLLLGFHLYEWEQRRRAALELEAPLPVEPICPQWLIKLAPKIFVLFFALVLLVPIVCPRLPWTKSIAHAAVAFAIPSYHICFALVTGLYILLASTGHGEKQINRFLAASFWKPPARLSLCVVLINIEVIGFICLTQRRQVDSDFYLHSSVNMLAIFLSYLVAAFMYILFEAPIRGISNHLLARLFS